MVRRRVSAVSNHLAPAVAAAGLSSFETPLARLLRMRTRVYGGKMTEGAFLYILRCADGSYYIGTTRINLELRIAQPNTGAFGRSTNNLCPVTLVYPQWFARVPDALENERKLKKW